MQIDSSPDVPELSFWLALFNLGRRPQTLIQTWNWKSAVLSIMLRGPIFLGANLRTSVFAGLAAFATECAFCAVTSGLYGAIVQLLRMAQPQWLTGLFLTVMLPALIQVLEYLLHRSSGTPHIVAAEFLSAFVSGTSAAFNWYVMRRSALLVGAESSRFATDLLRLPKLLYGFLTFLPRWWLARRKPPRSQYVV